MGFSNVYASSLVVKMFELQRSELFCDATILLDNYQLKAHSVVLAAASPKLKTMIECLQAASRPLTLEMAGCTSEVAEIMLEYLYTGNVVGWNEHKKDWGDLIKLFTVLEIPLPDVETNEIDAKSLQSDISPQDFSTILADAKIVPSTISTINSSIDMPNSSIGNDSFGFVNSSDHFQNFTSMPCLNNEHDFIINDTNTPTFMPVIANSTLLKKLDSSLLMKTGTLQRVSAKKFIIERKQVPKPTFNFFKTEPLTNIEESTSMILEDDQVLNSVKVVYSPSSSFKDSGITSPNSLNFSSILPHMGLESSLHDIESGVIQFPEVSADISVDVNASNEFDGSSFQNVDSNVVEVSFDQYEMSQMPLSDSSIVGPVRVKKSTRNGKHLDQSSSDDDPVKEVRRFGSFECNDCKRVFQTNAALLTHMRCHRKKIPHSCSDCHQIFGYPVFLSRHMFEKHRKYVCPKCGVSCTCPPEKARQLRDQVMNSEKLICQECGKACSSKETMRKHQLIHTTTPSEHICEICGKNFRIKCQLSSHLALHNQQLHKCNVCKATFPSQWKLDMHGQTHKEVRPIECTICHARFVSRQTLRIHFYRHEGTEFKCPHCSKVLSTPFNLRNHMKIHLRETHKNFKCNVCGKFYYDYKDLSRHKKSHIDHRPHSCPKCDRAFKSKAHLKYHLNSHNNEGPVECEICGATFKKKYSYQQHLSRSKCRGVEGARGKKRERAKLKKFQEPEYNEDEMKLIEVNASDIEEHYVQDGII